MVLVRLGIGSVRGIGEDLAETIAGRPYADMEDLVQRTGVTEAQLDAGHRRRLRLLRARAARGAVGVGAVAQSRPGRLAGVVTGADAPALPGMAPPRRRSPTCGPPACHRRPPTRFVRDHLDRLGVCTAARLAAAPEGKVVVAGVVTHRNGRPPPEARCS